MHAVYLQTAVVCYEYDPVVAMETAQVALNPHQAFQTYSNQSAIKCLSTASVKKNIHNGPILMKLCQPVLGVRFFSETQCRPVQSIMQQYTKTYNNRPYLVHPRELLM